MTGFRYRQWDGSQEEFSLDVQSALEMMSDLMMEGLDAGEALEWMRRFGFQLAGMNMRVMGTEELRDELRNTLRSLFDQYSMDQAMDEVETRGQCSAFRRAAEHRFIERLLRIERQRIIDKMLAEANHQKQGGGTQA